MSDEPSFSCGVLCELVEIEPDNAVCAEVEREIKSR